ncbi:glutathione synthase [Gammaproteobacteria bacterium]|nr:glutathione synthase [Gammaproteobacteria bacterium]
MKFLFVMDPLDRVKAEKDTSYHLMLAAAERGHEVFFCQHRDISLNGESVTAPLTLVDVHSDVDRPFSVGETRQRPLATMDRVLVRTDPPFDRRYFYATLLLDRLPATTQVINRPQALRDINEKLGATFFPSLTPETLVSSSAREIADFARHHGRITVKPIDGHGGRGIEFVNGDDEDSEAVIRRVTHDDHHWAIAQRFLPEASGGDKRILLLDGEFLGAVLRVAAEGKLLNNLDQGGQAVATTLTERERAICAAVGPWLVAQGVRFAGIDVIGDWLIEVNVTSPTGLQEASRFQNEALHHRAIAAFES